MEVRGRTFLVAGGGSGLGAATAEKLADGGANVIVADLKRGEVGDDFRFVQTDVTDEESVQAAVDAALELGGLHGAINCASVAAAEKVLGKDGPHSLSSFAKAVQFNLIGTSNVVRLASAAMQENEPTEDGERGEIVHRSPQLMTGYWGKPEETEEAFEGGWFHSEDLGYFDEEGYLYVVDRVKDVINTGGMQVSGGDVEDALFDHEAVSEVAVIGLPDEKWIEAVSAVVVLKEDAEGENLREQLEEHAREKLADFKRPKHIFFVEDLPRNAAGKILKRELRKEFADKV